MPNVKQQQPGQTQRQDVGQQPMIAWSNLIDSSRVWFAAVQGYKGRAQLSVKPFFPSMSSERSGMHVGTIWDPSTAGLDYDD